MRRVVAPWVWLRLCGGAVVERRALAAGVAVACVAIWLIRRAFPCKKALAGPGDDDGTGDDGTGMLWPVLDVTVPTEGRLSVCADIGRKLCTPNGVSESDVQVQVKELRGGTTNAIVHVRASSGGSEPVEAVVRVYGDGTGLLIDRQKELMNIERIHAAGMGPKIYGVFRNGFCVDFVGGQTLERDDMSDDLMSRRVAECLARWHMRIRPDAGSKPELVQTLRKWLHSVPTVYEIDETHAKFAANIDVNALGQMIDHLETSISKETAMAVGFGHNDLLCKNILYDSACDTCHFIDFEYGFTNYTAFDIANHWCEFAGMEDVDFALCPAVDFKRKWLRVYLAVVTGVGEESVLNADIDMYLRHCDMMTLAAHLFWGIWALHQAASSTIDYDYIGFACMRFDQYKVDFENISASKAPPVAKA